MYYAPQNPKAFDLLEPDIAKLMPTYPDNEKLAHIINFDWWADNLPMMQRRFQQLAAIVGRRNSLCRWKPLPMRSSLLDPKAHCGGRRIAARRARHQCDRQPARLRL